MRAWVAVCVEELSCINRQRMQRIVRFIWLSNFTVFIRIETFSEMEFNIDLSETDAEWLTAE